MTKLEQLRQLRIVEHLKTTELSRRVENIAKMNRTGALSAAISEVEKMRDEWLEMKRNYKIDDSLWVAHKNYVNAATQILDRLRSLSPEAGE
jgi:hypothetical protein